MSTPYAVLYRSAIAEAHRHDCEAVHPSLQVSLRGDVVCGVCYRADPDDDPIERAFADFADLEDAFEGWQPTHCDGCDRRFGA